MLSDRLGALARTRCGHLSGPGTPVQPCKRPSLARRPVRSRCTAVVCKAANKTLYEVLEVSQDATERDIKRAFRQKALKLHPDVNKAPDAQAQFMEAKNAFTVLSDKEQRAEYNRKLRGGSYSWGSGFGDFSGSYGSQRKQRSKQQEEDFYGLEDFFNDLGKELDKMAKERPSDKPMSLWDELAAIGEELVEYMEDSLGLKEGQDEQLGAKSALDEYEARFGSTGSRSNNNRGSPDSAPRQRQQQQQYQQQQNQQQKQQQQQQQPRPPEPPKRSAEEDIDEMLAALKRKMNR